jgi:hypothetical protein
MRYEKDDNNEEFEDEFKPYFDTDDEEEGEEDGEDIDDEEYLELLEKQTALEMVQLELVQADMNIRVMNMAIELVSNSWFWGFRSEVSKLHMIQVAYLTLMATLYPKKEEGQ